MLSVREVVQKINSTFVDAKLNIAKPVNVLELKIKEFIEDLLPNQRNLLDQDVMEVFKSLTGSEEEEEKEALKTSDETFIPVFKGIWKETKEKLFNTGMTNEKFEELPLTFRSQEVFHMKVKGLIIEKSNGMVKFVKSDGPVLIRHKSANGTKSQGNGIVGSFTAENSNNLEYQMFVTEKAIEENLIELKMLENRKTFLGKQIQEEIAKKELNLELKVIKEVKEVEKIQEVFNFYEQDLEALDQILAA